jgi:glycosyltransferase A (GT-A) superfamily protein (DUF2064 family)
VPRSPLAVVLCRPPDAPDSKTRLASSIGRDSATEVYRRCLTHVLDVLRSLPVAVRLAVAGPPLALADLCVAAGVDAELVRQLELPFAARQAHELARGLADGHPVAFICASDLPSLRPAEVRWAVETAGGGRVAVVPSADGGYSLLASSRPLPELAEVPMSVPDTGEQLVAALHRAGHRPELAPFSVGDVDDLDDLLALRPELAPPPGPGVGEPPTGGC